MYVWVFGSGDADPPRRLNVLKSCNELKSCETTRVMQQWIVYRECMFVYIPG